jgi:hypothetical protein
MLVLKKKQIVERRLYCGVYGHTNNIFIFE